MAQPENALVGVMYHGDPVDGDVVVSNASHWVFNGTGVVNGTRFRGLLGYETDAVYDNGYSPAGLEIVATSPDPFGNSHMVTYTAPSGRRGVRHRDHAVELGPGQLWRAQPGGRRLRSR